jgi:hypothetical protein
LDKVINYKHGNGFEAELGMYGAGDKEHGDPDGTDMKWCYVYEIIPPSSMRISELPESMMEKKRGKREC